MMDLDKVRNADQTDIVTARERFCRIVPRSRITTEFIKQTAKGEGASIPPSHVACSPYIYRSHCICETLFSLTTRKAPHLSEGGLLPTSLIPVYIILSGEVYTCTGRIHPQLCSSIYLRDLNMWVATPKHLGCYKM
jgi:hypothetical protein